MIIFDLSTRVQLTDRGAMTVVIPKTELTPKIVVWPTMGGKFKINVAGEGISREAIFDTVPEAYWSVIFDILKKPHVGEVIPPKFMKGPVMPNELVVTYADLHKAGLINEFEKFVNTGMEL